jgi:PKD repeat protein
MSPRQGLSTIVFFPHHVSPSPPLLVWVAVVLLCLSSFSVDAGEITLAWDPPSTEYGGFILAYGTTSGNYAYRLNIGRRTSYTVSGLDADQVYYFAVKTYSTTGKEESSYFNEVSAMVPVPVPQADFYATPTSGFAPLAVAFTDASSGRTDRWSWNFGDGMTSTERHPVHTYTIPGTYTVKLTVSGEGGSTTKTTTDFVSVGVEQGHATLTLR